MIMGPPDAARDMFSAAQNRFKAPVNVYDDPVVWAKRDMGIDLWSIQRQIMRMIDLGVPKVAVKSCNDAGKSFISSLVAARYLSKYPPRTARVVTTAPNNQQVRGILWNEINSLHAAHPDKLPGRVNQTEWWIDGYMAAIGRKPSDYAPETFSGFHAEHILVIIDEAGSIPDELWTGVDTLVTNAGAQILAIGNPTDPNSEFKRVCDGTYDNPGPAPGWEVIQIAAWDTPNFTGEEVSEKLRKVLLDPTWVEDKKVKWGEGDARYESRIEARFPSISAMAVVRLSDLLRARNGFDDDTVSAEINARRRRFEDVQLGVDIAASETGDKTVIRERRGRRLCRRWEVQSDDPDTISGAIVLAAQESEATVLHVDATGVGFGFIADLRHLLPDCAVQGFISATQADDPKQFENRRAEAYWFLREGLRKDVFDLSELEDYDEVQAQLTSVKYKLKNGKIAIQPKSEIRAGMGGKSPDDADALVLAVVPPAGGGGPVYATASAHTKKRDRERDKPQEAPQRLELGAVNEQVVPASRVGKKRRRRTLIARAV